MVLSQEKLAEKMENSYSYILGKEDCFDLAEDILRACDDNASFMVILKEWMNGKTRFHNYVLHNFSLIELAYRLDEQIPNIPIAILIFYLEETAEDKYRALTVVAHQYCVCDKQVLIGELCKFAIKDENIWYFLSNNQKKQDLRECQMWQVLLLNPRLIIQMTYDHENGTAIILQDDYSYMIVTEADRKE